MTPEPMFPAARPDADATMSDADFEGLARHIHAQTGIVMNASKRTMLVSRLSRRLRKLGLPDFASYRKLLETQANGEERRELISAITTNVTSFFREPVHFDALAKLVPSLAERARQGERIRIWSAGCSSGEEPYSIAMTLIEHWPGIETADVRILATDIDPQMIEKARKGVFAQPQNGQETLPVLQRHMKPQSDTRTIAAASALKDLLRFEELNLLDQWPFNGMFDVIFCRNVVIYFDAETRLGLWRRFAERLHPGGTLFIGHSERVDADLEPMLASSGVTQYRRMPDPGPAPAISPGRAAVASRR
ncbi:protein-glutamate O-methyltransferase [Roseibacterium sp. SDUM158017]|uniref:CheR family methyltransferase n=1 Tax=Roseicyclus salinarum TaxID=3036773 RepID=UPI002414D4F2|nr:protein-glutamate O-methyltransferase [Roseibacterium sp. SDUM158017]MDG4649242.1 protein-glutamate O-methyltransferase [Roseibacterium sp. SDUM158017]